MKVLVEHGAKLEASDDRENSPLDWAISFGSGVMVQALLEQEALLRNEMLTERRPWKEQ